MLKHEDWPGLEKISALRGFQAEGSMRPISILCGNGGLFLDFEMERGADGAMTGYAFPDMLVDVVRLSRAGERDEAHDLFDAHLPLLRYEQQPGVGLAVRKYVLQSAAPSRRRAARAGRRALSRRRGGRSISCSSGWRAWMRGRGDVGVRRRYSRPCEFRAGLRPTRPRRVGRKPPLRQLLTSLATTEGIHESRYPIRLFFNVSRVQPIRPHRRLPIKPPQLRVARARQNFVEISTQTG